jgi:hypothetical protein
LGQLGLLHLPYQLHPLDRLHPLCLSGLWVLPYPLHLLGLLDQLRLCHL